MRRYLVIYERAEDGGWGAYAPDLPGCFTLGETRSEAERHIREAITAHLGVLRERGEPIPEASSVAAEMIEVPA
jgi:predicted RNase H-like HicB family nuclease